MVPIFLTALTSGLVASPSLSGVVLPRALGGEPVDLGALLAAPPSNTLLVLGTYPADFNMIEYAQKKLASILELPPGVELLADEQGEAGRRFGVGEGWLPDSSLNPYLKLLGMLVGLGASATLPSVITGYLGNPSGTNAWIEASLAQGQTAGRWPDMALDLDGEGKVTRNAFAELPLVGGWGRRPLELATLRLQTMLGVSLSNWQELAPVDDRVLTQLGGCVVVAPGGETVFEWRDGGICNTANFEDILAAL